MPERTEAAWAETRARAPGQTAVIFVLDLMRPQNRLRIWPGCYEGKGRRCACWGYVSACRAVIGCMYTKMTRAGKQCRRLVSIRARVVGGRLAPGPVSSRRPVSALVSYGAVVLQLTLSACTASVPAPPPASGASVAQTHWFTAADSPVPSGDVLTPNRRCLKEVGCPFAAKALPTCPTAIPTVQLLRDDGDVVVSGTLGVTDTGRVRASGCPQPYCCERHERMLQVTTAQGLVLVLFDEDLRVLPCKGDQSLICCGVPLNVQVVVRGRLGWVEALGARLVIRTPEICQFNK